MPSQESIEDKIRQIVVKITRKRDIDFKPETSFKDLDADSLDKVQILVALEDAFDIEIADEDMKEIGNMGEFVAYIRRKIGEKG
jgi:acyl carrier protein